MKKSIAIIGLGLIAVAGAFVAGLYLAYEKTPAAPVPAIVQNTEKESSLPTPTRPLLIERFNFNSEESSDILNAVLKDWFTNPKNREKALSLLVDPMAGPFDGSRPTLKRVVIDSRTVIGSFIPRIPETATIVADGSKRPPLKEGELGIWINSFAVEEDATLSVVFTQSNHGDACKEVSYMIQKQTSGWKVQMVCANRIK